MSDLVKVQPQVLEKKVALLHADISLFVEKDLDYFKGHFPDAPILAGVVQLHWAVEFAKELLGNVEDQVLMIEVLKFKAVIVPGQHLQLQLEKKDNGKITFSYTSQRGDHASGRIVFAGAH